MMHLSNPKTCKTQRVNPNVNYALQLVKMYHGWFLSCTKGTILMHDVIIWETVRVGEKKHGTLIFA